MVDQHRISLKYFLEQGRKLPPEVEEGNIEYKLKLRPGNEERLQHLTSQLQWRLTEHGECFYMIGVEDDGSIIGLYPGELDESLEVLKEMCQRVDAKVFDIQKLRVSRLPELFSAQVCIRSLTNSSQEQAKRHVKIAFVGETNSGKSTLVGVLSGGTFDNGNGSVRLCLLRHRHEVLSGQTSSVSIEFLPFDTESKQLIRHDYESLEPISLGRKKQLLGSSRVSQLLDLPGDVKYQKVTYSSLTSWASPDWVCVVISAIDEAKEEMMKDIFTLVLGLELPFFVVITKTDLVVQDATLVLMKLKVEITNLVNGLRKELFGNTVATNTFSILKVSNVTGEGINNLVDHFFRLYPKRNLRLLNYLTENLQGVEGIFCVEGIQNLPEVGTILSGTILHGSFNVGASSTSTGTGTSNHNHNDDNHFDGNGGISCWIGPLSDNGGCFLPVRIRSAHRMRLSVHTLSTGQLVTLAIKGGEEDGNEKFPYESIQKGHIMAIYNQSYTPMKVCLPIVNVIEADVTGCTLEQASLLTEPVKGVLYWLGNRWNAQLASLNVFYGESIMRATFLLMDSSLTFTLPGARVIFVGPNMRIQGISNSPSPL